MLTLRLSKDLEAEFLHCCERRGLTKTEAAQTGLRKLLVAEKAPLPMPGTIRWPSGSVGSKVAPAPTSSCA
ncbi:MAG TPA: hypothetical protein PKA16_06250 [Ottowia sp.]|uniref:hypothetical protein n=1 Tax=Ottowia sp. TaxID=1898956 RepID=UPI002B640748|nr:hypothetical protein [Ottowia sp.]HMN20978.1 hypothetical protein [Ottowia sp.]